MHVQRVGRWREEETRTRTSSRRVMMGTVPSSNGSSSNLGVLEVSEEVITKAGPVNVPKVVLELKVTTVTTKR